jgi:hypothetical protein
MNRAELQWLARERIEEAKALLAAKKWSGAYYVAGYSVEYALKSSILAFVERTGFIFVEKKSAEQCWTHDLEVLLKLAGLEPALGAAIAVNPALRQSWGVVKEWTEASRYRRTPHYEAKRLYKAITDKANGVMQWLVNHW